ncbi:MAG: 2-oxoacid:ferredoxin oxidoreductase subunit beta [Candidatus Omnitrophota bacterium]|nr:2-oxoacid:ferredoxin oxidoreductase subunit beta [Candidatus Omnitrophota bacterium]
MDIKKFQSNDEISWCPGCGNFGILTAVKKALANLNKEPNEVLLVSGIGQAAKTPHYIRCNCFNGLHGRAIPVATASKIVNPKLTVLVTTGDGDSYGEGGNHFIHNIRRNIDITVIVHNNQIYGLTKGQASPTTDMGFKTKVQTKGVVLESFHALSLAITLGAGFVARGFSGDIDFLSKLVTEGIKHKGFSLIEVLQPCVSFNKKNTHAWYKKRIYNINNEKSFNPKDKIEAIKKSLEWGDKIPAGILYNVESETYEDRMDLYNNPPLVEQKLDIPNILSDFI